MNAVARESTSHPMAGEILYSGHCYDRRLRRCRIYSIANGEGGLEWRVVREAFDALSPDGEVERCFRSYADAIRWIA